MPFDPHLAAVRFGTGPSPLIAPPGSVREMADLLRGPDRAAREWPVPTYSELVPGDLDMAELVEQVRGASGARKERLEERLRGLRRADRQGSVADFRARMARLVSSPDGLRERLAMFWANHFTVRARNGRTPRWVSGFVEEAIRPFVAGRFEDMLVAAELHPVMLTYLDQRRSVGPDSAAGQESGRGLNENLAREMLELHTLGVDAPYGQADVRELAELLTGLTVEEGLTEFRYRRAQPGAETVLGLTYGPRGGMEPIRAVLGDLARHPSTAAHLAGKLARHFVADDPPAELVEALAATFRDTSGDLGAVTEALLAHPAAWAPERRKVRTPVEFVAASLRALGMTGAAVAALDREVTRDMLIEPLTAMGQAWQAPPGPDGWPDEAAAWATPHGLAARIQWARNRPRHLLAELPDPRDLVVAALGPLASEPVVFAARAAETRVDELALVLVSADFQRR